MTFLRGASLTTSATLGYADTADLGPTAGNGFRTRWPDDLAALQEAGITDVQITLDWARLQPKPNQIDANWAEWFDQVLQAAAAIDLRPWVCLHDGSIPRWFDNDGGLDDDEALTLWWPRWVERAADRFGDVVSGWVPFARIPSGAAEQPWIDTWGILGGGAPVVAAIDVRDEFATIVGHLGRMDRLGVVFTTDWDHDGAVDENILGQTRQRWGNELRRAAELTDDAVIVTGFNAGHRDPDIAAQVIAELRTTLDDAAADGVTIDTVFVEPAIAGPDSLPGLLDQDRAATASSEAYLTDTAD
jgi:beta-glucosidase